MVNKKRLSLCIRYWAYCNNKCDFCFEHSTSFNQLRSSYNRPSVQAIESNNLIARHEIVSGNYDFYTFKLMGGELFCVKEPQIVDSLVKTFEWIYSIYENSGLLDEIYQNRDVSTETLVIASNLMYDDRIALKSCLDVLKGRKSIAASTMLSYDLVGRFKTESSLKQYFKNVCWLCENYHDVVKIIPSFVLSRQNMEALIEQRPTLEQQYFDEMYKMGLSFDIQLLLKDDHIQDFAYSKTLLHQFVNILAEKYPRLLSVFKARSMYKTYQPIRKTIQCRNVFAEELFYHDRVSTNCLICPLFNICHHSYSDISYNATDCDVKAFLLRCN